MKKNITKYPDSGKKRAFSLVELLIGLVILGIISAGMVSMLGTGSTLMSRQQSSATRLTTERFTLDSIYNELRKGGNLEFVDVLNSSAVPATLPAADSLDKYIYFDGDRAMLLESKNGTEARTPLTGADGIGTLSFGFLGGGTADAADYTLAVSVDGKLVESGGAPRTMSRAIGLFGKPTKTGAASDNAIRFKFREFVALAGAVIDPSASEPFHSTLLGSGDKSGRDWDNAAAGIQDGITAIGAGEINPNSKKAYTEIWVQKGTYDLSGKDAAFNLRKGVKLYGGFDGTETTAASRDARDITTNKTTLYAWDSKSSVIECIVPNTTPEADRPNSADTRIDGFVITGKTTRQGKDAHGAGMQNRNTSPMVINCDFIDSYTNNDGGGMHNDNASPAVINCTFTNNTAKGDMGGGMCNINGSSPLVDSCDFSGNVSARGGGMFNQNSLATITNCIFSNNRADYGGGSKNGGGIENSQFSAPTITGCSFIGNIADNNGGGIYNSLTKKSGVAPPSTVISDCVFVGNIAKADGGGIANATGGGFTVVDVINSVFSGNEAQDGGGISNRGGADTTVDSCTFSGNISNPAGSGNGGGGIFNSSGSDMTVKNSTFSGNEVTPSGAGHGGGGIYNDGRLPTITNCTFADNHVAASTGSNPDANTGGGGILQSANNIIITNTILWGNTAAKWGNEIYRNAGSINLVSCVVQTGGIYGGSVSGTPITGNPDILSVDRRARDKSKTALTPANVYIYTILDSGSAYDKGTSAGAPTSDQRGVARSGAVDIGAFEYNAASHYPHSGDTYPILP